MATTVQFRNRDDVTTAFDNRAVDAWSIFQGKQFMFKGYGGDELSTILDLLEKGNNVIYTLQVYEGLQDAKGIKSNTQHDGSFNFRLNDEKQGMAIGAPSWYYEKKMGLEEKIKNLEATVEGLQSAGSDDDEDNKGIGGIINGYLNDPQKLGQLIGVVQSLLGYPVQQPSFAGAAIGQSAIGNIAAPANEDEKMLRLAQALDTLEKNDPNIVVHLEKLAKISDKEKGTFTMLIGMLNNMQ